MAFASKHPDIFTIIVSPGATRDTYLLDQSAMNATIRFFSKLFIWWYGSHSVSDGAKRYVDALTGDSSYPSGTFLAPTKGFVKGYTDATSVPAGAAFANAELQEKGMECCKYIFVVTNAFNINGTRSKRTKTVFKGRTKCLSNLTSKLLNTRGDLLLEPKRDQAEDQTCRHLFTYSTGIGWSHAKNPPSNPAPNAHVQTRRPRR